ncbi:MAG: gamma-glutamyl-gamma-aminobutyrate hydrolase family protein [Nitrospinota bacterium]|nr:gamma-glutamyl-gamma-aminobutyrate hydrolase family protein [Nitrospinota bacterium]
MSRAPVVGLTADTDSVVAQKGYTQERFLLKRAYFDAVIASGGVPLLIPAYEKPRHTDIYLSMIDGLIITGGYFDIDPNFYGEKKRFRIDKVKPERTLTEIRLIRKAVRLSMPTMGVCGGMQAINVAYGGGLYQDIFSQVSGALRHEQKPMPANKPSHAVQLAPASRLARIMKAETIMVNSTHHQAIWKVGRNLTACAFSSDGVAEAIEGKGPGFLLGVQWHPEQLLGKTPESAKLFKAFVAQCRNFKKSRVGR